MTIFSSTNHFN